MAAAAKRDRRIPLGERLLVAFAAFICLVFVAGFRDVAPYRVGPTFIPAPMLPDDGGERDAELGVTVVDESDHPVSGASVRVFAIRGGKAYFAGDKTSDVRGISVLKRLPRGETWVLAYGTRRSRASMGLVLEAGRRDERLVLHLAKALEVIVVDESDRPIRGADVDVQSADPLPYAAVTDMAGTARFDRLGPAPYTVKAHAVTYEDASRTGVVPGAAPLRLKLDRLGALVVSVVDKDGNPAAGAAVLAAGVSLWPARSTETGADGKITLRGLRGGVYDLKARRGDQASRTEIGVALKRGETKAVELKLEDGKRVTVRAVDGETEKPIRDASVVLVEEGLSSFPLFGRTNGEGFVVLGPISKVNASVSARAAGYVPTTAVRVEEADAEAIVQLHRGGAIVGDVVDDRGFPIPGATIEVVGNDAAGMPIDETGGSNEFRDDAFAMSLGGPAPLLPIGELGVMPGPIPDLPHGALPAALQGAATAGGGDVWMTKRDGWFRAEPVTPGRVVVIARHPSHVEAQSEAVTVASGGEAKVHIVMREGGWIEGRVFEDDRTPVAGARIEMSATQGGLERFAYTADDGTFTLVGVPGEVLVGVARREALGDVVARVTVVVPDRDRARVEIVLPKVRESMTVRVRDDRGFAIDRVEIRAVSLDVASPLRRTVFSNQDGEAEVPDAVGLPLRLTLVRPGKAPKTEDVDEAPTHLDVTLAEGLRAKGEVTGRGGRERLEGAEVVVLTPWGTRRATTDRDGGFEIADLAPGRVRVRAFKDGYAENEEVVVVEGDRDRVVDLGKVDLTEAGEVEGQVVDDRGDPVRGARVGLDPVPTWLAMGPLPRGLVVTAKDGTFTLVGVPEGKVSLEAFSIDEGRATVDVKVDARRTTRRVKIALPGGGGGKEPKGAGGVAISLSERDARGATLVEVLDVARGSEAEAAGLEPGDVIEAVNGKDVHAMDVARRRLSGPTAADVVVRLRRDGGAPIGDGKTWLVRLRRERVHR